MQPPTDLFDPAHYAATRRPLLEAETLPPWCYTSEAFYRREVERIFRKVWNFVGHVSQVANPGDYFALTFAGIPVIILRDLSGTLRAFANTCRHRGSALLEGSGNCRVIVCPYHSWTYALDGALRAAPEMQQTIGFDTADAGLIPLRLDTWGGFLFLCFDAEAPGLSHYLGDLPARVAAYGLEDMACARRKEYMIECNWKLFVENAKEVHTTSRPCTGTPSTSTPRRAAPATGSRKPPANTSAPSRSTTAAWPYCWATRAFPPTNAWPGGARPAAPARR